MRRNYENEVNELCKAIDLAVEAFEQACPSNFTLDHQKHFITTYKDWKDRVLNAQPEFRNLASLKYSHQDVFTYFQESTGPTVECFWKRLNEEGLNFKRENKLKKVLDRGKIRGRIEFDYVIDILVPAEQTGMINEKEAALLSAMIGEFESRK